MPPKTTPKVTNKQGEMLSIFLAKGASPRPLGGQSLFVRFFLCYPVSFCSMFFVLFMKTLQVFGRTFKLLGSFLVSGGTLAARGGTPLAPNELP